uniref:Uncharacterized protein n=1 Tax=Cannabis sativa TaxID=3483 RepID=A0A803QEH6_CANSA
MPKAIDGQCAFVKIAVKNDGGNKGEECKDIVLQVWRDVDIVDVDSHTLAATLDRSFIGGKRSRSEWLMVGDRNTKYFHNKASVRKKKNSITELVTENGQKLNDDEANNVVEIERYFSNIFQSSRRIVQHIHLGIEVVGPHVSDDENVRLLTLSQMMIF